MEKRELSVLIVDNDSANRQQWKAALESATFRVLESCSRVEALKQLGEAATSIDLLLIGMMRDGEGAQLAVDASELRPILPMIIVAGAANPVGIQGHLAILLEPVSDAELIGAARTLLAQ